MAGLFAISSVRLEPWPTLSRSPPHFRACCVTKWTEELHRATPDNKSGAVRPAGDYPVGSRPSLTSLLCFAELGDMAIAGNGQPSFRARFITEVRFRLSAADARVTDAP
jgi:hypothetical protein